MDQKTCAEQVCNRLPVELVPKEKTWGRTLSAVALLKAERNNALAEVERLSLLLEEKIATGAQKTEGA